MGDFHRWVMFEDTVSIQIVVRKLQKNYAMEVCRYSLKFCKQNVIFSNSTKKLLVQQKECCDVSLQVGRSNVLCVERSSL